MFWKNWPYWLKGGVIGLIILFISFLYVEADPGKFFRSLNLVDIDKFLWPIPVLFFISYSILIVFLNMGICLKYWSILCILPIVLNFVIFFIFGAIAGLIYGKIKKQK